MHFFGLSTLSSLQAEIIYWLAQTHDIEIYHNNVCLEYWGDIETKNECIRRLKAITAKDGVGRSDVDVELENPLLQNWGRAGRETLRLFVDLEEANGKSPSPIAFEWNDLPPTEDKDDSMLKKVQKSVRHRVREVGRVEKQDASIQIVGAPGIRREVEMAYNAILGAVWKPEGSGDRPWSDCTFSDIAILVPDMKAYRPAIEAVFGARGQIPYGLIDSSASEYSRYLEGFMALMAISREGLSRDTLFAALDNSCVQRALGFTPKDVREWRRYAKETGAFDGFEGMKNFEKMSWSSALTRLRLGMVAKDRPEAEGKPKLTVWEGGEDSALKFSEIVETLYRKLAPLAKEKLICAAPASERANPDTWADKLRGVAGEFLKNDRDDNLEESVRRNLFNALYALDKIDGVQGLDFVVAAVEEFVSGIKCRNGGYLTHGVTIAGLQPMRPVPFKQVFVLGMGEGMFPGRDSETTLEIRGAARTLGDVGATATNRYLFLETLMATRERLVISYPNLDIAKDAEMFPSGMVSELKELVEKNILPEPDEAEGAKKPAKFMEVRLPLLERGEADDFKHDRIEDNILENPVSAIRWSKDYYVGLLPTYSNVERGIARRIDNNAFAQQPPTEDASGKHADEDGTKKSGSSAQMDRVTITAKELAEFLESPLRAALRRQHGVAVEGYRDEAINPEAPLEVESGPTKWKLQRAILNAVPKDSAAIDLKKVFEDFSDRGYLPEQTGPLGAYSLKKAEAKFTGDPARRDSLGSIKSFADGFFPENSVRPDSVRVLRSAQVDEKGSTTRPEILYTAQTSGLVQSEDGVASFALVFNRCGDTRKSKGNVDFAEFPPKAVLEALVIWLMMVAGKDVDASYSLRVGIADMDQVLYNGWNWSVTPARAKRYVESLTEGYLKYLDDSGDDGCYLDYGYSDMTNAIADSIKKKKIRGKIPKDDDEWRKVIDEFSSDDYHRGGSGFNNNLVIERVVEPLSRMPENGENGGDLGTVKDRFEKLFKLPMSGTRNAANEKEA